MLAATALTSKGALDAVAARLDANGDVMWARAWGGPLDDRSNALVPTSRGFIVASDYRTEFTLDGKSYAVDGEQDAILLHFAR